MTFNPNPRKSWDENIRELEDHLQKRWFQEIFIGILAPLYPIGWLIDLPRRKKDKKAAIKEVKQKLSDPIYVVDWEIKEAQAYADKVREEQAELEKIQADFAQAREEKTDHLLGDEAEGVFASKEEEMHKKRLLLQTKIDFFEKYLNSLSLIKSFFQAEAKLAKLGTDHHEIVEILLYKQKASELEAGRFVNLRTLSQEMEQCQEQDRAELLMEVLVAKNKLEENDPND